MEVVSGGAARVVIALLGAAMVAACAAPSPDGASQPGTESSGGASQPGTELPGSQSPDAAGPSQSAADAWQWGAEPSGEVHAHEDVEAQADEPDGEALGEAGSDVAPEMPLAESSAEPGWVDPCTLVTDAEWADWTGDGAGTTGVVLEDGDACGWISGTDHVRMAIGAFLTDGRMRWLSAEESAAGDPISGIGDRAIWLGNWPIDQSSTLVIEVGAFDLVIEMSAQGPSDVAAIRDGAIRFAVLAAGRLP